MNRVNVTFSGQRYDNLVLNIKLDNNTNEIIRGYSNNGYSWEFSYPDSIYQYIKYGSIYVPEATDTLQQTVAFCSVIDGDTLRAGSYFFTRPVTHIQADYFKTDTHPNILFMNKKTGEIASKTVIQDKYFVSSCTDKELLSSIYFIGRRCSNLFYGDNHDKDMETYIQLTKQFPDSRIFIWGLSQNLFSYWSQEDIESVFHCFSEANQQSYWGRKIQEYLATSDIFENSCLPVWDTGEEEWVIQDSTKYNLVIFSASWCAPCRALVPTLKKAYSDLNGQLAMTYISIDKPETLDGWCKLMQKEEVSWRSLVTVGKYQEMKEKYFIDQMPIPRLLLIHPLTMKIEIIDHAEEKWEKKLYEGAMVGW
jgi:thiol-disulfide isomerase/thioredoxin